MNDLYNFDVKKNKEALVKWIKNWFDENGPTSKAVIGISGGKDSTVVAALCVEALGKERVFGVLMPNSENDQYSTLLSKEICQLLGVECTVINIHKIYKELVSNLALNSTFGISNQALVNLPARLRMVTLFGVAQSCNGRVSCNCNLSEDYVGYSTFGGDDFGSFAPLRDLTTDEIIAIGYELNLPAKYIERVPEDGLSGKTDEDNLGFSYKDLNKYIRTGICTDELIKSKIDNLHKKNLFKLSMAPKYTIS